MPNLDPEAVTFASVWLAGAFASLARTFRDSDYRDFYRACGAVACGGCIAFGFVSIVGAHVGGHFGSRPYDLGVAFVVGLAGKDLDYWVRYLVSFVTRIKLPPNEQQVPKADDKQESQ